jgi:hypothetical protein
MLFLLVLLALLGALAFTYLVGVLLVTLEAWYWENLK